MSKISYCSLEEAWGNTHMTKNNNEKETVQKETLHKEVVNNMLEYEKYRFNPINKVNNNNNNEKVYTPFNESIEKKYLQDKINYLENEFKKYKNYYNDEKNNYIENFSNNVKEEENESNNNTDIIDLILLIIIGLIVIFVMNSIFNMGKSIGAKNKMIQ